MTPACLIDTDILSEILKGRDETVLANADSYLKEHDVFAISAFTRYEIVRGLRWRDAHEKLKAFEHLVQAMSVFPVTSEILDSAASLWADGAKLGKPKMDTDLLIAATALVHQRELVTGNAAHFDWIEGITLQDWRIAKS